MTTLALNQVPPQIATVEQMIGWCGLLSHRLNPTLACLESENTSSLVSTAATFTANDGTERLLIRVNLKLDPNWQSSANKLWMAVQEFSQTQSPASYLA